MYQVTTSRNEADCLIKYNRDGEIKNRMTLL